MDILTLKMFLCYILYVALVITLPTMIDKYTYSDVVLFVMNAIINLFLIMLLPILIILNRFVLGKVFLTKVACWLQGVKHDKAR